MQNKRAGAARHRPYRKLPKARAGTHTTTFALGKIERRGGDYALPVSTLGTGAASPPSASRIFDFSFTSGRLASGIFAGVAGLGFSGCPARIAREDARGQASR